MQIGGTEKRKPKGDIKFAVALNEEQKLAKTEILDKAYSFVLGSAGTGKTLLACQIALDLFFKREVNKIIITRPTVGTEDNGFLPGSLKEKLDPWLVPIRSNFLKLYPHKDKLQKHEEQGDIEIISLNHFRGQTFEKAVIIVDEFQNLTHNQLKMAFGRLGKESLMIFCGDKEQIDLKQRDASAALSIDAIPDSNFTYKVTLIENHRHPALEYVMKYV